MGIETENESNGLPGALENPDLLPIGSITCTRDGTICHANSLAERMFGWETGELQGKHVNVLIPPSLHEEHSTHMKLFFDQKQSRPMHHGRIIEGMRKDGSTVYLTAGLSCHKSGDEYRATALILDLTEKVQAEKSEKKSRSLLEDIHKLNEEHVLDPRSEKIYSLMAELFVKHTSSEFGVLATASEKDNRFEILASTSAGHHTDADCFEALENLLGVLMRSGQPLTINEFTDNSHLLAGKNGYVKRFIGIPLRSQGVLSGFVCAANKINEYKPSEVIELRPLIETITGILNAKKQIENRDVVIAEMRRRELQFRSLIENSSDPICILSDELRLIYASPATARITGKTINEMNAYGVEKFIHPDDVSIVKDAFKNTSRLGGEGDETRTTVRFRFRVSDGSYGIFDSVISRDYSSFGEPVFIMNARDVTAVAHYQETLVDALKELRKLNDARSVFMGRLSHELRTPLSVIMGLTDMMLRENATKGQEKYMRIIQSSGDMLLRQLSDLLEATRFDNTELKIEPRDIPLRDTLETFLEAYEFQAKNSHVEFFCHISNNVPERIVADPARLKQVLSNLLSNALKYTGRGAVGVYVETAACEDPQKLRIRFTVADTGPGIPESAQEAVFMIYSRGTRRDDGMATGTGLGLYIVQQLVEKMNGSIRVVSPSQKMKDYKKRRKPGTDFVAEVEVLPSVAEPASDEDSKKYSGKFRKKVKVLVAEDHPGNRLLMERMLSSLNAQVTLVVDGIEAVEAAEKDDYDIMIFDINMPEMSGLEAAREIRKTNDRVPIICLSAAAEVPSAEILRMYGVDHYLVKPIWQDELLNAMVEQLGAGEDDLAE